MSTEKIERVIAFAKEKAEEFGAKPNQEFNKPYVFRNNTGADALPDNGAYFGFIHPDEEQSGPYHDFSLTVNPSADDAPWFVNICIGSSGFKNDYDLATRPGLRRLFSGLVDSKGFCKSDFSDMESSMPKSFTSRDDVQHFKRTISGYTKLFTTLQIVDDPESERGKQIIAAFIAGYAKIRDWPSNNIQRSAISNALAHFVKTDEGEDEDEIEKLLRQRKFLVLQGPPGTGKTRLAKLLADKMGAKSFFTQFHAETTYSDFISGIRPRTDGNNLGYSNSLGIFGEAVKFAKENEETKTLLIIDEINRANLANVLGPVFYLFEHMMDQFNVELEIAPGFSLNKLPDNLFVVATMNTADRSLAVVDFALRRRFAWYDLKPKAIAISRFYKKDFEQIKEIFEWYASSDELSLQPGQGYFIASDDAAMTNRVRFEIFPLIKEYLQEGLLRSAREEFNNYFSNRIKQSLFE